jgi:hypothetical protein
MIDPKIDLTLFHYDDVPPNTSWRGADRLNSWARPGSCRFLEWMGWYNYDVAQRLLGHYRLFQHFKTDYAKSRHDLPAAQAYILQYRARRVKHFLSRVMVFLIIIIERQRYPKETEMIAINRQLVNDSTSVLYDFLTDADQDFTAAFLQAMRQIKDPSFFGRSAAPPTIHLQVNQKEENYYTYQHNTYSATQINIQPAIKAGAQGKDSGIFSKKQVLILFDFLSAFKDFDSIDYTKSTKFEGYVDLLYALTGKSKPSILKELNDYHNHGLYEWHTQGELKQLIITLINLADTFRNAQFRSFAKLLDKKIRELESHIKD